MKILVICQSVAFFLVSEFDRAPDAEQAIEKMLMQDYQKVVYCLDRISTRAWMRTIQGFDILRKWMGTMQPKVELYIKEEGCDTQVLRKFRTK